MRRSPARRSHSATPPRSRWLSGAQVLAGATGRSRHRASRVAASDSRNSSIAVVTSANMVLYDYEVWRRAVLRLTRRGPRLCAVPRRCAHRSGCLCRSALTISRCSGWLSARSAVAPTESSTEATRLRSALMDANRVPATTTSTPTASLAGTRWAPPIDLHLSHVVRFHVRRFRYRLSHASIATVHR